MKVFQDDPEFGWIEKKHDSREHIVILTKKFNTINSVKSFPCAMSSKDATVCSSSYLLLFILFKKKYDTMVCV